MQFFSPRRSQRSESIVPMINVVFLLLIFLLLTAEMAPPEPFPVTPPAADLDPAAAGPAVLYVGADGTLSLGAASGAAALAAIPEGGVLYLRADAALPAAELAALLPRLAVAGELRLVTVAP